MRKSLKFNGIKKPWLYLLEGRNKSPFAPIRNKLIYVPGMPGAYLDSATTDVLYITQPIGFVVRDDQHALELKDELAEWLITDEPAPLEFEDELGRIYFAKIEGTIEEFHKFVDQRKGVITFLCADPFAYGPEQSREFVSDVHSVRNDGTAKAKPIIELTVKEPITFAMVQNNNDLIKIGNEFYPKYMMLGKPVDVENQAPFVKYEKVYQANTSSTNGWADASNSDIDGGVIAGNIISRNGKFVPESYGTGTSWHGPGIKQSLTEPLKDFRLEVELEFLNNLVRHVGRIEVYLKDNLGQNVCKVAMKDTKNGGLNAVGEIRAGGTNGHYLVNDQNSKSWNDLHGVLRVEREGKVWKAYVGRIRNGQHTGRLNVEWEDQQGLYMANVAQIVIHFGQIRSYVTPTQSINDISIYKIIQQPDGIPYIAGPGDKIVFDSMTGDAYINGEPRNDLLDFGSDFINLVKGDNQLVVHPSSFDTLLRYRKPYR